jgi:hypothetical protein
MKYLSILILFFFVSSCYGTKEVIENQPEPPKEVAVVTKVPKAIAIPEPPEPPNPATTIDFKDNAVPHPPKPSTEASSYKELMHNRWNTILQKYVSDNGNVDYQNIKNEIEFDVYIDYLSNTQPDSTWSKNETLSYWINAYNAFTIDLILRNYPLKSIKDIKDPWDQRLWKLGDKWYNLNDIEHKILRKMNEPRIHFAIVCASISCPKLENKAFTASNLEEQLTKATKAFLSDATKNELSEDRIILSKIFKWFKKDFEQHGSLIDFLNQYSEVSISSEAKKSFNAYNWNLND